MVTDLWVCAGHHMLAPGSLFWWFDSEGCSWVLGKYMSLLPERTEKTAKKPKPNKNPTKNGSMK